MEEKIRYVAFVLYNKSTLSSKLLRRYLIYDVGQARFSSRCLTLFEPEIQLSVEVKIKKCINVLRQ